MDTQDIKDRVVQETIEQLCLHLAANSRELYFPEMCVGLEISLRKFRKNCSNNNYRKSIQQLLEAMSANRELIVQKRNLLKQRQLSSDKLQNFQAMLHKTLSKEPTPLERERNKALKMQRQKQMLKETQQE